MLPSPSSPRLWLAWASVFALGAMVGLFVFRNHYEARFGSVSAAPPPAVETTGPALAPTSPRAPAPSAYDVAGEGFHAALYTWLLLGVPLAFFTVRSRRSRRDTLILKLSQAVEQSRSGILIVSPDGIIEFVNEGLCTQLGFRAAELTGRPCTDFRPGDIPAERLATMLEDVRAGRSSEIEWENRRKDGRTYPAQAVVTPVHGARAEHLGYIAVISDLTQRQLHQEELKAAKDLAEAGDRAKGAFLATMSHEVRTPLNGIVGFTNLLLETPLTLEQREYVQTIRTSGEALVQLTGDILDFSRIESGGLELDTSVCDVRATVEDALDILAGKAAEKGIELLHWTEPDIPCQLMLDGGRLRQVLVNLIANGIKFTSAGQVEVSTRLLTGKGSSLAPFELSGMGQMVAELDDGGLTLEFSVRDTGIGISVEDRSKLFQPFTQLDVSTVRRYGGAGLGLAISRNLVRLMDGDIWLESEPRKGSVFTFTVRARPATACELVTPPQPSLHGCRIGIVSDHAALRSEWGRVLALCGAEVDVLSLEDVTRKDVDVVMIDCTETLIGRLDTWTKQAGWDAERFFGMVNVTVTSLDRQFLRPHFRMLLNKPVHHRTLASLLSRAAKVSPNIS